MAGITSTNTTENAKRFMDSDPDASHLKISSVVSGPTVYPYRNSFDEYSSITVWVILILLSKYITFSADDKQNEMLLVVIVSIQHIKTINRAIQDCLIKDPNQPNLTDHRRQADKTNKNENERHRPRQDQFVNSQRAMARLQRRQKDAVASLGGLPRVTPSTRDRGVTPEGKKLWLNLQRTVDKWGRTGKKGAGWHPLRGWHPSEINKSDSDEQKMVVSVLPEKNRGDTVSCRPGWHQP